MFDIDPDDDDLAAQLGSIKWDYGPKSRVKVESKEDMRKRGMPSPDRADALMMTLADVPMVVVDDDYDQSIMGDVLERRW